MLKKKKENAPPKMAIRKNFKRPRYRIFGNFALCYKME